MLYKVWGAEEARKLLPKVRRQIQNEGPSRKAGAKEQKATQDPKEKLWPGQVRSQSVR